MGISFLLLDGLGCSSRMGDYVEPVKRELREIIVTVAEFEPVRVLVPPDQIRDAQGQSFGPNVEIIEAPVDDIWMRDIAPTFALSESGLIAVDWNFNGWGSTPHKARSARRPARRLDFIQTWNFS
jgi:agmatine deiminase